MASYTISAPNGKSYTISGPAGASQEAVQAEVLRQYPNAGTAAPAAPEPKSVGGLVSNLVGDVGSTISGTVNAVAHPVETAKGLLRAGFDAGKIVKGAVHTYTDDPSVGPTADKSAYTDFANSNYEKYGTVANALNTVYKHPLAPALTVAQLADPALRVLGVTDAAAAGAKAVGGVAAKAAAPLVDAAAGTKTGQLVQRYATAPARAEALGSTVRGTIADQYGAGQTAALDASQQADATVAAKSAAEGRLQARRAQIVAAQDALKTQRAAAEAASVPRPLAVADPQHLDTLGGGLRTPAVAGAEDITTGMKARDTQLRAGLQEEVQGQAADNVGVSDLPEAQALVERSKALVNPEPGTAPGVGGTLADSAGGKVHKEVIAALTPETVPLTAEQAAAAKANGIQGINQLPDGTFTQTIKPGYDKIDALRRHLFQVARGKVADYGALEGQEARSLYSQLGDVLNKYSDGTHGEVQANYAAGKQALVPFDKSKVGQAITATQKGAPNFAVPTSKLPALVMGGGADTLNAAEAVAGKPAVSAARRAYVQNELSAIPNTSEALTNAVRPGSKLGNLLETDPALKSDVYDHIAHQLEAERHGQRAVELGQQSDMYDKHIQTIDKVASTLNEKTIPDLQKASETAAATARDYETKIANITDPAVTPADQVGDKYLSLLDDLRQQNKISPAQYAEGRSLAGQANAAFKDAATRAAWQRHALQVFGGGGTVLGLHAAGVPLALGAGLVGLGSVGYVGKKALQRGLAKSFKGH